MSEYKIGRSSLGEVVVIDSTPADGIYQEGETVELRKKDGSATHDPKQIQQALGELGITSLPAGTRLTPLAQYVFFLNKAKHAATDEEKKQAIETTRRYAKQISHSANQSVIQEIATGGSSTTPTQIQPARAISDDISSVGENRQQNNGMTRILIPGIHLGLPGDGIPVPATVESDTRDSYGHPTRRITTTGAVDFPTLLGSIRLPPDSEIIQTPHSLDIKLTRATSLNTPFGENLPAGTTIRFSSKEGYGSKTCTMIITLPRGIFKHQTTENIPYASGTIEASLHSPRAEHKDPSRAPQLFKNYKLVTSEIVSLSTPVGSIKVKSDAKLEFNEQSLWGHGKLAQDTSVTIRGNQIPLAENSRVVIFGKGDDGGNEGDTEFWGRLYAATTITEPMVSVESKNGEYSISPEDEGTPFTFHVLPRPGDRSFRVRVEKIGGYASYNFYIGEPSTWNGNGSSLVLEKDTHFDLYPSRAGCL